MVCLSQYATELLSRLFSLYPLLVYFLSSKEFFGKDRPRQLALNKSITSYQLRNLAHDTEYVISLYVLFGSVEGPGITTSARTCEYNQGVQAEAADSSPLPPQGTVVLLCPANRLCLVGETTNPEGSWRSAWESPGTN